MFPLTDDRNSFTKRRSRASRLLRGKVPAGWKLRTGFRPRNIERHTFRYGCKRTDMKIWPSHYYTATLYLGPRGVKGFPYLKMMWFPDAAPCWHMSNWAAQDNAPHCAALLAKIHDSGEMKQVSDCLQALYYLTQPDEMNQMIGIAKARELKDWLKFPD